jgi:hypothetical protein
MKNDGMNTAMTDTIARNRGTTTSALPSSTASGNGRSASAVRVDVFDRDRRFVDQNATASARPPSVMMLIVCPAAPQGHHCREQREGNRRDHDGGAAPIAEEQQHHHTREHGAENRLPKHGIEGSATVPDWSSS